MNEEDIRFTERVLPLLESDIEEQIENNLRSEVLVADWKSFQEVITRSKHQLYKKKNSHSNYLLIINDTYTEYPVHQTRYFSHYEARSMALGFGFRDFECLQCGNTNLLYDEEKDVRYCPKHG